MIKMIKALLRELLLVLRPVMSWLLLSQPERLQNYQASVANLSTSGMVDKFNFWHRLIYKPFFKRVQHIESDITKLKNIKGPTVYIMKNKGQLEYRYFNYIFLKEKVAPVSYANNSWTLYWLPMGKLWRFFVTWLNKLYLGETVKDFNEKEHLANLFAKSQHALLNLTISRDYLFGLIKSDPMEVLKPLVEIQQSLDKPLHIVTLQFMYDQHPDKTEKTYFDLLFGEKSNPGALRKVILFILNYRRKPRVKFSEPINLQDFLAEQGSQDITEQSNALWHKLEDILRIEQARIIGPRRRSREAVLTAIKNDESFNQKIEELAKTDGKSLQEYKKSVGRYLHELAADLNYSYVHFVHVTLSYIWNGVFDGYVVKHEQLNKVREVAGKNPVVLVPMHRSHIDYLLLTDLFYMHNITFPYICAGINLNFFPVGRLVRKCGGFFIRRSFDGNKLYQETLFQYIKSLLGHGHSLEFFIEGTRSRTGKLLSPKMGILSMIMRAFYEGACEDIYFVPIAVSYDNLLEQKVYQKEGDGDSKSKENAGELLKARKIFNRKYGKVYIEFSDPISFKDFSKNRGALQVTPEQLKVEVSHFAYHLTYFMNKVALVTPIALVSLAILSINRKTFNVQTLMQRINLLRDYLDFKEVSYSDLINYSDQYAYNETIKKLHQRGILKEVETFEERFYSFDDKHRADLDYYKNNILHFFVSLVVFCKIVNALENFSKLDLDAIVKQYELIKKLLKHDFIFSMRDTTQVHLLRVITYCHQQGLVRYDSESKTITKTLTRKNYDDFCGLQGLLDNFFESNLIALRYVKHTPIKKQEKKAMIKDILVKAKPVYLKGNLKHPEALSSFNFEGSFKVMVDLGLLAEERGDKGKRYFTSTGEVESLQHWIESLENLLKVMPPLGDPKSLSPSEKTPEEQDELH